MTIVEQIGFFKLVGNKPESFCDKTLLEENNLLSYLQCNLLQMEPFRFY